jgi:hypothetical protein
MSDFSIFGAEVAYILGYAAIALVLVQIIKGSSDPEQDPPWFARFQSFVRPILPWIIAVLSTSLGLAIGLSVGKSVTASLIEGLIGGVVSMGFYDIGSITPGLKKLFGKNGWL